MSASPCETANPHDPCSLTLEASGRQAHIALGRGDRLLEEQPLVRAVRHNLELLPAIDDLSRRHQIAPRDLTELYIAVGPGSFTGLRCAIAVARMFAHVLGCRLVAMPTAAVLAEAVPVTDAFETLVVLQASKRETIFATTFHACDCHWEVQQPGRLEAPCALLATLPRPTAVLLEATAELEAAARDAAVGLTMLGAEYASPRAAAAFALGRRMARKGRYADPLELTPLYPREPEAAILWQERRG